MFLLQDMLIRLKNGHKNNMLYVIVKYSSFCEIVLEKLYCNGFILFYRKIYLKNKVYFKVYLKYTAGSFFLNRLEILSKPSRYTFCSYKDFDFSKIMKGQRKHYLIFLSTSKGILTHIEAKDKKVGGLLLFKFLL